MIDMLKGARDGSGTDLDLTKLERRAQSDEGIVYSLLLGHLPRCLAGFEMSESQLTL